MSDIRRTVRADGATVTMTHVAGGSFVQVMVRDADGVCTYAHSHQVTTDAERDFWKKERAA